MDSGAWVCVMDSEQSAYLLIHEFGHSFAGLGDEYYTSQVAYETFNPEGVEPWEPNVTALGDPQSLKWKDLVADGTPIPTPWNQDAFDKVMLPFETRRRELRQPYGVALRFGRRQSALLDVDVEYPPQRRYHRQGKEKEEANPQARKRQPLHAVPLRPCHPVVKGDVAVAPA